MPQGISPKPLFWVGSARKDVQAFPKSVRQVVGFALWEAQEGGTHPDVKPLKGFGGADTLEVVADHRRNTYRAVYTVRFKGAVYVLHAFQKKSKQGAKTPRPEIELARRRLRLAEEHYAKWRASEKKKQDEA